MDILSYSGVMKIIMSVVLAIASLFTSLFFDVKIPYKTGFDIDDYELTWSDEFDGDALDTTKWTGHFFSIGDTTVRRGGYWNAKLCSVEDGDLHIATKYFPNGLDGNGKPGWYTAGIDTSKAFSQKYGYFECRCILPKGDGQWSAFWMFCSGVGEVDHDGEKGAEIDIYESPYFSRDNVLKRNSITSNIHINGYGEHHRSKNAAEAFIAANNPYEEYNTYGLEWNENEYIFYINGVETGRSTFGVSKVPEWLILSVEIGGENGVPGESFAESRIDTPDNDITDFIVDYVRVYKHK